MMASSEQPQRQAERLAEAVGRKILSRPMLIAESEGEITIRIFRRAEGFDIKLTLTT